MSVNIAVNGLGRIGRCVIQAIIERNDSDVNLVAINGTGDLEQYAHLLKYDSVHGIFPYEVRTEGNKLLIGSHKIKYLSHRSPSSIPWDKNNIDIVLECTGKFKDKKDAQQHIEAGAKKVIISAPSPDPDATIVFGVNHDTLKDSDRIVSVGSCTTNALAPVVKVINDAFTIEQGYMTTIHAYTNDQTIIDNRHSDPRRARACGLSMIPTSTGAAKAIGIVLPELSGKLSGSAIRVPTPNVSMVDLTMALKTEVSEKEINEAVFKKSKEDMRGILAVAETKLVSIDFNHNPHSSIFDPFETHVNKSLVRVVSWYDNEWGFSNRMIDVAKLMDK